MELAMLLYAASIAENLRNGMSFFIVAFFIVGLIACVITGFTSMNMTEQDVEGEKFATTYRANKLARKLFIVCFFSWTALMLVVHLVPARKDVYVMAGGYVALKAVKSEVVQTTANSVLGSIEHWLDKELSRELSKSTTANVKKGSK